MTINKAFLGHGIFTELSVTRALARYAAYVSPNPAIPHPADSIDRFINAIIDMNIASVWIQLFSHGRDCESGTSGSPDLRLKLIARLNKHNISWAGWGYCASYSHHADLNLITQFHSDASIAPKAFVIDAEPGNELTDPNDSTKTIKDTWDPDAFEKFVKDVNQIYGRDNLALSSWPTLYLHTDADENAPALMQSAAPYVCAFAPQAYWLDKPQPANYADGYTQANYPLHDPIAFIRLCLDDWSKYLNKWKATDSYITARLITTGGAYWGSDGSLPLSDMEAKLLKVVNHLPAAQWGRMIGFNWYHAGMEQSGAADAEGSMSDNMIKVIAAAKLQLRAYQKP
jgi:hypothetical protein